MAQVSYEPAVGLPDCPACAHGGRLAQLRAVPCDPNVESTDAELVRRLEAGEAWAARSALSKRAAEIAVRLAAAAAPELKRVSTMHDVWPLRSH